MDDRPENLEALSQEFKELAKESAFFLSSLQLPPAAKTKVQGMLLNIVRYCGELQEKNEDWKLLQVLGNYFRLAAVEERMRRLRSRVEDKQAKNNPNT